MNKFNLAINVSIILIILCGILMTTYILTYSIIGIMWTSLLITFNLYMLKEYREMEEDNE